MSPPSGAVAGEVAAGLEGALDGLGAGLRREEHHPGLDPRAVLELLHVGVVVLLDIGIVELDAALGEGIE
jgi:hypothetical protein